MYMYMCIERKENTTITRSKNIDFHRNLFRFNAQSTPIESKTTIINC